MIDEASMTGEPEPIRKVPHEKPFLQSGTKARAHEGAARGLPRSVTLQQQHCLCAAARRPE